MINEFEDTERENLRRRIKEVMAENEANTSRGDIENDDSVNEPIAMLTPSVDTIQIINKINEIINEFNKSLISNRI